MMTKCLGICILFLSLSNVSSILDLRKLLIHGRNQYLIYKLQSMNKILKGAGRNHTYHMFNMFSEPTKISRQLARCGYLSVLTQRRITERLIKDKRHLAYWRRKWLNDYNRECKIPSPPVVCDTDYKYRTIDGTCNNLKRPQWGSAATAQARFLRPHYDNGYDSPRNTGLQGTKLPSARVVSNVLHRSTEKTEFDPHLTVMHMSYGQFLDHDLIATPIVMGINNSDIQCCGLEDNGPECIPIDIPTNDPFYNRSCMSLTRSSPAPRVDRIPGAREQLNEVTSYIDASAVYGSTEELATSLRTMKSGMLLTTTHDRLPSGGKSKCFLETEADYCQKAGDKRVNVVPNLGALHLLFLREHNRIAGRLAAINPAWDDETIYQESRKIVAAITQHITYNEYLPEILGQQHMETYGLYSNVSGFHRVYDEKVDASIRNVVGAAAFRFGHSQVPNHQAVFNKYRRPTMVKPIELTYHRPHMCAMWNGRGADGIMRWLTTAHSTASDRFFETGVRDKLFQDKNMISMDLPAVNIQRGRDHGIPGYNEWRKWCSLPVAKTFSELRDHDRQSSTLLSTLYRHPDDIDLFAGAMAETKIPDSLVGPTFACILSAQFQALKRGDRFWYENPFQRTGFTIEQLNSIKKITLAKVICENIHMHEMQAYVFRVPSRSNPRKLCSLIPDVDLRLWRT